MPQSQECYDQMIVIKVPENLEIKMNAPGQEKKEYISVDPCLASEIIELWEKGIVTTGCCCGHNLGGRNVPFIGVREDFIPKMKEIGYKVQPNQCGNYEGNGEFIFSYPNREDSFVPKSI